MLSESGRRVSAPMPLDHVAAVDQAVLLRKEGLSFPAIAAVMRLYHGQAHGSNWWQKVASAEMSGTMHLHFAARLTPGDYRVMDALAPCPLTALQLAYKVRKMDFDHVERSLERLRLAGKVASNGKGIERQWRAL